MPLTAIDREACERAIAEVRSWGGADKQQIEDMLRDRPRERVLVFAAYSAQDKALGLRPWEVAPCRLRTAADVRTALAQPAHNDPSRWRRAGKLVQRLLAAKLSRYEPDPIAALEAAERAALDNNNQV